MKIRSILLRNVGPLAEYDQSFEDDWKGGLHEMILFSGPNGCGKSSVLRSMAYLWTLTGRWLSTPGNRLIEQQSAADWFKGLLRTMPLPADLVPLWNKMNL